MTFLLNHLLEASAERHPESTAVVSGDRSLTYGQLEDAANRLANALIACGVTRGDRVGIHLTKSIWSVVSVHAIHKAGAAYVPLDPNAPPERARYILGAAGIKVLITERSKALRLTQPEPCSLDSLLQTVVSVDDCHDLPAALAGTAINLSDVLAHGDSRRPESTTIWTDLAYILFTSGSTGKPKGVMISHLNALNFVNWAHREFGVSDRDVVANHAPLHFDLSIFDVFASMKAGATVALVPDELAYFPYALAEWIERQRITIWYSVPSILSMLVRQGRLERFPFERLRTILFAGEVFPVKHLRQFMSAISRATYYNLYGPTETNVITYYRVEPPSLETLEQIPIGRACANTEVFVIDDEGRAVTEPGIEGELYARGSNVAAGYWGDADGTRRAFVNDPRSREPVHQVYRTGDIVKLGTDGNLVFIGRRDEMVKSRGYRIELGEIESVMYRHPRILEAAVVAIPDEVLGNRIKAFAVSRPDQELAEEEVRRHCSNYLPKYMIPESVELRDSLPRTSTGKVDKTALKSMG